MKRKRNEMKWSWKTSISFDYRFDSTKSITDFKCNARREKTPECIWSGASYKQSIDSSIMRSRMCGAVCIPNTLFMNFMTLSSTKTHNCLWCTFVSFPRHANPMRMMSHSESLKWERVCWNDRSLAFSVATW